MPKNLLRGLRRIAGAAALPALVLAGGLPVAAQPTELFFSEYIEGTSNNKALEIFNGTAAAIDLNLGGYNVQMFFNGNPVAGLTINLVGVVAPGDVFVLAQSAANATILAQADQTSGAGWFNGDDAVVLRKGTVIVDSIGQAGFDPGTEWGTGVTSTADNTLRRKASFCDGDPIHTDVFDPAIEWDGFATDSFGDLGVHDCVDEPPPPPPSKEIFEIEGAGLTSPFVGQTLRTLDNVVTGVAGNGFFIQTPDLRADADPETSNGIFVFTSSAPTVLVGDQVDVQGTVAEFFTQTEISGPTVTVDSTGNALPAAQILDAVHPSPFQPQPATEMERFEGMIVRVENAIASGPTDQFGDTPVVAQPSRAFREPGILFPGLPALPVWDGNPEIFEINADGAGLPDLALPAGAAVSVAEGPLAFSFGDYQIWPTTLVASGSPTTVAVRAREPGEFTVASQNMLRLMDAVDDPTCSDDHPTAAQYASRLDKVSRLIRESHRAPDVVVAQEVENLTVLQDLAAKIHADDPSLAYTAHLLEGNDVGCIDIGFLTRDDTVEVDSVTQFGLTDTFVFGTTTFILNDRPPLVLAGRYVGNGEDFPFTVIGVHQRSLSGIDDPADGPRVRAKRHEQALRLSEFIQTLQTGDPDLRLVVTGDFNAFEFTDGYVDVLGQVTGNPDPAGALIPATDEVDPDLANQLLSEPAAERYSFVFDGSAQALDHALTSSALAPFVRGLDHIRGNADTPASFLNVAGTALRAADHDGLDLFLMSDFDADGVADDEDNCPTTANPDQADADHDGVGDVCDNCPTTPNPDQADADHDGVADACKDRCLGTVIPETAPTHGLKPLHYALVNNDLVFDTVPPTFGLEFDTTDTAGCSCEQIADQLHLGNGHKKNGCNVGIMGIWTLLVK